MAEAPVALKALLRQRHWKYATFCSEYDKAAKSIDPGLTGSWPSRAQFQRWLAGELRGLPYPDACRVLEAMFPGWTIEQLFSPSSDQQLAQMANLAQEDAETGPAEPPRFDVDQLIADRFSDVSAVYATRSEFLSSMPVHTLLDSASSIRACGLSLNLLCQQYADHSLRRLAATGTAIQCLFLDPDGTAIADREREEGFAAGRLSDLTRLNILTLNERVRDQLPADHRTQIEIATYDETLRFNIILIDGQVGVIQPYLPGSRGIDSPTFVLHRRWENQGLFPMFESIFSGLWAHGKPL
jgi:Domain of unknown function (DUF5919)